MSCWKRELSGVRKEMQTEPGSADSTRFGETLSRTGFSVASQTDSTRADFSRSSGRKRVSQAHQVDLRTDVK